MSIILSQDNLTRIIELPVMPGSISFNNGNQNQRYDLINLGEAVFLSGDPLETISLQSWFPGPGEITGLTSFQSVEDPDFYINAIKEFKKNNKPIRLTITEIELTQTVGIEAFNYQIAGGDGEYSYTLELVEYRSVEIIEAVNIEVRLNPETEVVATTASIIADDRPNDKRVPTQVTVVSGDSLWKIARKELGDGSRYPEIAELNDISQPYLIFPGQVLLLP